MSARSETPTYQSEAEPSLWNRMTVDWYTPQTERIERMLVPYSDRKDEGVTVVGSEVGR